MSLLETMLNLNFPFRRIGFINKKEQEEYAEKFIQWAKRDAVTHTQRRIGDIDLENYITQEKIDLDKFSQSLLDGGFSHTIFEIAPATFDIILEKLEYDEETLKAMMSIAEKHPKDKVYRTIVAKIRKALALNKNSGRNKETIKPQGRIK